MSITCMECCIAADRFLREDEAVTAIEYGLLAALIAVACIAAFQATGGSMAAMYEYWSAAVVAALAL